MSILENNLNQILNEKTTKIIPENIKKGVQVFDVIGALETGSGGKGDVKLFETQEEMQVDTTAKEGDLAVIYRSDIKSVSNGDTITNITFPKTVVFTEAITSGYRGRFRNSSEPRIYLDIQLDASNCSIRDMYGTIQEIEYSSIDGITYTRTDSNEDTYEIGETTISGLEEHICQFIQTGGNTFEGLYTYKPYIDNTSYNILTNIKNYDDYNTIEFTLPDKLANMLVELHISTLLNPLTIYSQAQGLLVKTGDTTYDLYTGLCNRTSSNVTVMSDTIGIYIDTTNNKLYYSVEPGTLSDTTLCNDLSSTDESEHKILPVKWSLDLDTETSKFQVLKSSDFTSYVDGSYTHYNYNTPVDNTYAICGVSINRNTSDVTIKSVTFADDKRTVGTIRIANTIKNKYAIAPTQLTSSADNVYKSIFYGKNGVETGTLTENIAGSFADINAEIYTVIKQTYDSMEPKVLTDSDKTIDKNIYFIPTNSKGQVLLNTSAVTNTTYLFEGCTNLTTIPLIDTSSTTKTIGMFKDCSNLVTIPLIDTSNVTDTSVMFQNCSNLINVPLLDISKAVEVTSMFYNCTKLETIPLLDTSNATNLINMFGNCSSLTEIPQLNISKATKIDRIVSGCTNLSDESLNNILAMCTNATNVTSNKTLKNIGLTSDQATKCTTLSNYFAFTSAGWTTGY